MPSLLSGFRLVVTGVFPLQRSGPEIDGVDVPISFFGVYLNDLVSSVVTPLKELKGFRRVSLQPGASERVTFTLGPKHLALLDRHLEPVVEPGTFEVMVGGLKATFEVC